MDLSNLIDVLLKAGQIIGGLWAFIFGSKSVYDLLQNKRQGKPFSMSPFMIISVVLAILLVCISTAFLFFIKSSSTSLYPPDHWKLAVENPMKAGYGSWYETSDCRFAEDIYHVTAKAKSTTDCLHTAKRVSDFALEVQMVILKGDLGGLDLRYNPQTGNTYYFWIDTRGTFGFEIWNGVHFYRSLISSSTPALNTGYNQPNVVAVVAQGNTFSLYINKKPVTPSALVDNESSFKNGFIGVGAYALADPTEVLYSNVKIWVPNAS